MIKRLNLKKLFLVTGLGVSMLFLCTSLCLADFVTANLTITPTPCKRGDVLHFKVTVFNNPSANTAPGTAYFGTVVLDNTNQPQLQPWHSERLTFDYPYPNKTTIMNFTATYTVPQNAGNTICFYVVEGAEMNNRISYKHCIQVKPKITATAAQGAIATFINKANIVVETFAYKPAPLKAGNNIDMFITFKNKGSVKSDPSTKYSIACTILSGGGPDKKCAVASVERTFGKEILPGETLSLSLLGATPAEAGSYKVTIGIVGQTGAPYSTTLNVAPKLSVHKVIVPPPAK